MLQEHHLDLLAQLRDACDLAIEQHYRLQKAEEDRDYWKKQYMDHLNESIRHGEVMMGNVLLLALNQRS